MKRFLALIIAILASSHASVAQPVLPGSVSMNPSPFSQYKDNSIRIPRNNFSGVVPVGGSSACLARLFDAVSLAQRSTLKFCDCITKSAGINATHHFSNQDCSTVSTCELPTGGLGFTATCTALCHIDRADTEPKRAFEQILQNILDYLYVTPGTSFDEARAKVCTQS